VSQAENRNYRLSQVALQADWIPASESDNLFRIEKRKTETASAAALPINNCLKSPEEIENEFLRLHHGRNAATHQAADGWNENMKTMDGDTAMHGLDVVVSGFMEENY
jgi:hypothetical protein